MSKFRSSLVVGGTMGTQGGEMMGLPKSPHKEREALPHIKITQGEVAYSWRNTNIKELIPDGEKFGHNEG